MANGGGSRPAWNIRIGDGNAILNLAGKATQAGAENEGNFRGEHNFLADSLDCGVEHGGERPV